MPETYDNGNGSFKHEIIIADMAAMMSIIKLSSHHFIKMSFAQLLLPHFA